MELPFYGAVVLSLLVAGLGYILFHILRTFFDLRQRNKYIYRLPGNKPHWFWGHLKEYPGPNEEGLAYLVNRSHEMKANLLQVWFGPLQGRVAVHHPDSIKIILRTSEPKPRKFGAYAFTSRWLGDSILLGGGSKWARNRRLLTPAFHFDILRPYVTVNNRCVDIFLEKLQKFAEKGEFFEVFSHVSLLTLDIILRCAFSYENDCQVKGESHPYVQAVSSLTRLIVHRFLRPWLHPEFLFNLSPSGRQFNKECNFVHKVSEEIIQNRKRVLSKEGAEKLAKNRYRDFVDILLTAHDEDGRGLSDQEIRDEADTFLFAGHDTTASGISFALYLLATHPEAQKKCQEEIDEVLSGKDNMDIEWDDLPKLKYLTMCLKESLRLNTPVPVIERETTKDMEIEGYFVPAGTMISIHLYIVHHSPKVWDNPNEFLPERFSQENQMKTDNYAFVPFSAGPRNCIGQHFALHEMKVAIARVLSRFTVTADPSRPARRQMHIVLQAENGIYLKVTPRQKATSL